MEEKVLINNRTFHVRNLQENQGKQLKISFDFTVTNETSHDVTTLLYENDFVVQIPGRQLEFPATIHRYYTSITNLYEAGAVGEFHLELIENK
ncbi:DUF3219 family protein [Lentibacillus sediminis]|uniref:DUF3219 family protein n=1 Tax=Lentibacillus sediminis TaxID=1940529 RepID=UPI000C1C816D|nr:DUF3219 family protein [Lentibacillus sediminis]